MVSRDQRLRKRADFVSTNARGRRAGNALLLLRVAPSELPQTRWGLAVSRRTGGAVARNRVRRHIREAIRSLHTSGGKDVIVTARPQAAKAGLEAIRNSLEALAQETGLMAACVAGHEPSGTVQS